jgi:urease accessory protein
LKLDPFSSRLASTTPWAAVEQFGGEAPELARYQDEPPQMASGSVGKTGYLRLGFERREHRTILVTLERRVPLLVQRALYWDSAMPGLPCVFIVTTSGCVLQGDRLALDIELAAGAQAHVTTQSATKIHTMEANYAAQEQTIRLHDAAYLEFLPDVVIPHRGSRFISKTRISIAPTATMLFSEILLPGRKHHHVDETFGFDVFSSLVAACNPRGRELFAEKLVIEPRHQTLRRAGVMGPFDVFGNVFLLTPKVQADRIYAEVGAQVDAKNRLAFGACRLPNDAGLVFKVLGMESQPVKQKVREFWAIAREVVVGAKLQPEFLWR